MGRHDKDRTLKELAIRYCLARHTIPFLEVVVPSVSDLSVSVEVLTDLDVLGVEATGDGGLRRTIFDCKSSNKMSSVNRAFWAAGVKEYTGCDEAYVILKNTPVHNHRISALSLRVDLHDEQSFCDLGKTIDPVFPAETCYQASIDRWNRAFESYEKNPWAASLQDGARNLSPITQTPAKAFRRLLADLRSAKGMIDPEKKDHIVIFLDLMASAFVLWAVLGRDARRFYEPQMDKARFEQVLRFYLWGGKESYEIRQQLRDKAGNANPSTNVELPAWNVLISFVGMVIAAPLKVLDCAHVCRELSLRVACGEVPDFDRELSARLRQNTRVRQFILALSDYLTAAGALPPDLANRIQEIVAQF